MLKLIPVIIFLLAEYYLYCCCFRSLLVQLQGWYEELAWPYDEDDTILCIRYSISAILTTAALAILLSTLLA